MLGSQPAAVEGNSKMNTFRSAAWCGLVAMVAGSTSALAQPPTAAASYGPGRITCHSATSCELGIGTPASLKYRVDPSALPEADKSRLTKQCTAKGTPCIATVTGTEARNVVKAAGIKFHN
jgi:hypothetical protein